MVPRRQFLRGLASITVCAPAVVRASNLMAVNAKFCGFSGATLPWVITREAPALLQHELERRFAETLFGADHLSAEAESSLLTRRVIVKEAKMTALWELRTLFGPRGSRPQPLEDLPCDVQAGLLRCLEPTLTTAQRPARGNSPRGGRFPLGLTTPREAGT
jgi:hypothetical protein